MEFLSIYFFSELIGKVCCVLHIVCRENMFETLIQNMDMLHYKYISLTTEQEKIKDIKVSVTLFVKIVNDKIKQTHPENFRRNQIHHNINPRILNNPHLRLRTNFHQYSKKAIPQKKFSISPRQSTTNQVRFFSNNR